MRPILAIIVSSLVLGGLWLYIEVVREWFRPDSTEVEIEQAPAEFGIELTPSFSFSAQALSDKPPADPFAVAPIDDAPGPKSRYFVRVALSGRDVQLDLDECRAGVPIRESLPGIVFGDNELTVEASLPPTEPAPGAAAIRVRVLRNGIPVEGLEQTFWAAGGPSIFGRFVFKIETVGDAEAADEGHDHD